MRKNFMSPIYMAGVADSDGSFSLVKKKDRRVTSGKSIERGYTYLRPIFQLTWSKTNKAKRAMKLMSKSFGGKFLEVKISKSRFPTKEKTALKFSIEGRSLYGFIKKTYPYLRLKKEQANIIKKFYELRYDKNMKKYGHRGKIGWTEKKWKSFEKLYIRLRLANTKNNYHA